MTSVLRRPVVLVVLLASLFVVVNLVDAEPVPAEQRTGVPYVTLYTDPDTAAEVLINQGDGQAFAALAQDPTMARPEVYLGGRPEAAYRAQRPLLGWLGWLTSAGQAAAVPLVLFVWAVVGVAVLVEAVRRLAADRNRRAELAALALVLPGAVITLDWTGPEALGTGLALLGVWRWDRRDVAWAVLLLTAATLCRETLLLVPIAVGMASSWRARGWDPRVVALLACPAALGAWWMVIRWRLGHWPTDAGEGRLGLPLRGLIDGADRWGAADASFVVLGVLLVVLAARNLRGARPWGDTLAWVAAVHVALAVTMGGDVWKRWEDFGRPLLPLYAALLVLALPWTSERRRIEHTFPGSVPSRR